MKQIFFFIGSVVLAQEFVLEEIKNIEDSALLSRVEKEQSSSKVKSEDIEKYLIKSTTDLVKYFPNLKIYAQGSDTFPLVSFRGISSPDYYSSVLGVYVDGIPQSPNFLIQNLSDIEDIVLINGSEGLLYGENAPLGLISITTKNPMQKNYAYLGLQASVLQEDINAQVGWNLIKDKLWGKIHFRYLRDNGFVKDPITNKMLNYSDSFVMGTSLYYQATENILLNANYSFYKTFSRKDFFLTQSQIDNLKLPSNEGISWEDFSSGIQDKILNKTPYIDLYAHHLSLKMDYFMNNSTLSIVSALQKNNTLANSYPGIYVKDEKNDGYYYDTTQIIGEAKLQTNYKNGIESLLGIYYKYLVIDNGMKDVPTEVLGYSGNWDAKEDVNTAAIFANISIPFKKWVLHTGLRYQLFHNFIISKHPPVTDILPYQDSEFFHAINPRISLFYHFKPYSNFFVELSNSTKPGGFSKFPFADTDTIPYYSEQIYSIEVGNKTFLLNNHLKFKSAFYGILRTNTQSYVGVGYYKSIKNIGNAYAMGLDLEISYAGRYFNFFTNLNIGTSKFFNGGKNKGSITILGKVGEYNLSNLRPKFSPILSFDTGFDIFLFKKQRHLLTLSILSHFTSSYYLDDFNREKELIQKSFVLLDAALSYEFSKKYQVALFCQNLTDTRYITTALWNEKGKAFVVGNPVNIGVKFLVNY
ncbi:TonB-dependent receptor [Helicobacter sp. faydin-H20]|uniref:TonB-dependent receptor n=1 Tax=Helicobacter anatolicus TaxID=2905874 RepID=UPI001E40A7BC|nr:TonB-dependent receptor [Helicobacter anatolicus]MCE3037527.1 TonB-dependent receptor [Helicobacter anatolicus]